MNICIFDDIIQSSTILVRELLILKQRVFAINVKNHYDKLQSNSHNDRQP